MSTPVGHSDRQPLHDRHRSRASRTSVDCQPAVGQRAGHHLLQHPRTPAGRVLLPAGRPIAGTHQRRTLPADASTDPDAAADGRPHVAVVRVVGQVGPDIQTRRLGPAQRIGDRHRVHDDARIEQARRVPERLELPERGHHPGREHARQQGAACPAVTMLPGQRAAVTGHQVRSRLHEATEACLGRRACRGRNRPAGGCTPRRSGRR